MLQAELVPRIHPFRRECGADSSSSDLHSGNKLFVSAPVSCLLTDKSAMTGFHPDSFRCFGTVLCAQLRGKGWRFAIVANCAISFTEWNMMVNSLTENPPAMDCTIGSKSSIIILKKEEMLGLDSLLSSIIENGILYYPQKIQTFFVHNL